MFGLNFKRIRDKFLPDRTPAVLQKAYNLILGSTDQPKPIDLSVSFAKLDFFRLKFSITNGIHQRIF